MLFCWGNLVFWFKVIVRIYEFSLDVVNWLCGSMVMDLLDVLCFIVVLFLFEGIFGDVLGGWYFVFFSDGLVVGRCGLWLVDCIFFWYGWVVKCLFIIDIWFWFLVVEVWYFLLCWSEWMFDVILDFWYVCWCL